MSVSGARKTLRNNRSNKAVARTPYLLEFPRKVEASPADIFHALTRGYL